MQDILIAVVDGLKGFPEAITAAFPSASVQTCIVHLSRYCLSFCGWKERQALARELEGHLPGRTAEVALNRLTEFEAGPGQKVSDDRRELAPQLGTNRSLLRLRPGGAKYDLYHQRD